MMQAAMHVKPFGFDRIFHHHAGEQPVRVEEVEVDRSEIDALQADMARIAREHEAELAQARAEAFQAGLHHARTERDAALLAALDAVQASFDDIDGRLKEAAEHLARDAAEVAFATGEALAGHAVALTPGRAADEALGRVLQQVARGTQLTIRVHPALVDEMNRLLRLRVSQERRKLSITIAADEDVAQGDAVIMWDEGGLSVDGAARRAAVLAEFGPLLRDLAQTRKEIDPARIA